jgi:hypothetical protein
MMSGLRDDDSSLKGSYLPRLDVEDASLQGDHHGVRSIAGI